MYVYDINAQCTISHKDWTGGWTLRLNTAYDAAKRTNNAQRQMLSER
jgi:hypothetical protein